MVSNVQGLANAGNNAFSVFLYSWTFKAANPLLWIPSLSFMNCSFVLFKNSKSQRVDYHVMAPGYNIIDVTIHRSLNNAHSIAYCCKDPLILQEISGLQNHSCHHGSSSVVCLRDDFFRRTKIHSFLFVVYPCTILVFESYTG